MAEMDSYPDDITSLYALIARAKARYGDAVYLIPTEDGLSELTFADLEAFVRKFADYLDELGIPQGAAISSVFHNSTLATLLFLGTIAAGRVYVPLNPKMGESEVAHILTQTTPTATFCNGEFSARIEVFGSTGTFINVPDEAAFVHEIMARPAKTDAPAPDAGLDTHAEVIFTSGSTGLPKGAMLTHRNLLKNAYAMTLAYGFAEGTRFLTACPLFHNSGQLFTTLAALWCGGCHVPVRSDFAMLKFWHLVDRYRLEWTLVMNAYLALLVQRPEEPAESTMEGILSGGSKLKRDLVERFESRFGVPVYQCYGLTETTSISTAERPDRTPASQGSAGRPLPGCRIRIADAEDQELAPDEQGEIQIAGEHIFSHYINQPDVTAEKKAGGWLRTGDLGCRDAEGNVFIIDRLDSMIHIGGENIYPSEIEKLSTHLEGVEDIVVTSIPNDILGAELVLVYKAQEGAAPDPSSWTAVLAEHLSTFKIPNRRVAVEDLGLDAIPRAANGKVLRGKIKALVNDAYAPATAERAASGAA